MMSGLKKGVGAMGDRENQKKFNESSNIRRSEFDRLNTNATRRSNPIGKGQNFLPRDPKKEKGTMTRLVFQLVCAGLAILSFLLINYFGGKWLPTKYYDHLFFLFINIAVSGEIGYIAFRLLERKLKL